MFFLDIDANTRHIVRKEVGGVYFCFDFTHIFNNFFFANFQAATFAKPVCLYYENVLPSFGF